MTPEPMQYDYELIFQALDDGSVTVDGRCEPSGKPMQTPLYFIGGGKIDLVPLPPTHSTTEITSIVISFTVKDPDADCMPSPFGDGKDHHYHWHRGQEYAVARHFGTWCFSAVLTDADGKTYTLPDPEFQVGAGGGDGRECTQA